MTIQQDSIPALSKPRNKVVVVEDIQLQILTLLNKYSARKCKLNYSFAIKNTKLTLDVDILPWEENHYTVAGGRGARRRRKRRRKESGHVSQRNTPTAEAETPRNILPDARSQPRPTLTEKPVHTSPVPPVPPPPWYRAPPPSQPTEPCGRCPLVCTCMPSTSSGSERPALQVPTTRRVRGMDLPTTPEEPLRKVAELLDKQNQKIDLNDQPWFFDSISRQQVSDLLQDKGKIGDFVVRESSKYGHYALSWKDPEKKIRHMDLGKKRFDSLEALVQSYVKSGLIIRPLEDKLMHKKDAETRGKRSLAKRIFCFFCNQYHGPVHFCHRTQKWRHVDTSLMMEIVGDTRESVERPPGYDVDDCDAKLYKSKGAMFGDLCKRSKGLVHVWKIEQNDLQKRPASGPIIYE